jgi:hypothetical protein
MAYEQRDNSGSVFVNDRKETDKHPDRTGTAMIDGVMYYVSGWIKEGNKGKFMSLAFKRKDDQPAPQRAAPRREDPISSGRMPPRQSILPDDEEVPF